MDQPPPPMQTIWGTLEMTDAVERPLPLPGEPFNPDLLNNFSEYVGTFTYSSDASPNANLITFDPLNFTGGFSDDVGKTVPQPCWLLNTRTCAYANPLPVIIFQAVKPPAVPARLIILEIPRVNLDGSDPCPHGRFNPSGSLLDIPHMRTPKIEWDCQQPLALQLPGWPTALKRPMTYDRTPVADGTTGTFLPIENLSGGMLSVRVAQRPMPGSIFPLSFDINIFKSFVTVAPEVLTSYYNGTSDSQFQLDGYVV